MVLWKIDVKRLPASFWRTGSTTFRMSLQCAAAETMTVPGAMTSSLGYFCFMERESLPVGMLMPKSMAKSLIPLQLHTNGHLPGIVAGPHPIGRQETLLKPFFQGSPNNVGQGLCDWISGTCHRINQGTYRGMANWSGKYPLAMKKIQSHDATVVQRKLQRSGTLLFGDQASYATIYLVGQPILAGHGFQLQNLMQVFVHLEVRTVFLGNYVLGGVRHDGFRWTAKHISQFKIHGLGPGWSTFKKRSDGLRSLSPTWYIGERSRSAMRFNVAICSLTNDQAHALLRFVANDFGPKGWISNGQLV